jgi:hypothetical protein
MMLTQLADVARRTGYPVIEVKGWKNRGRPGGMLGVRTVTCHHTANGGARGNYPSLRVVRDGRSGLPGPLAQYGLGVDGTIYVIAAGRCNHAGVSLKTDYINSYAIGIEAEAVGVPGAESDWPPKQMDSYRRLCKALVEEFGDVGYDDVRGHKETCSPKGRKSDPSFNMVTFRADVKALTSVKKPSPKPPVITSPPRDFTDMATEAELKRAVEAGVLTVLQTAKIVPNVPTPAQVAADPNAKTSFYTPVDVWKNIESDQDKDRDATKTDREQLRLQVAALDAAVRELTTQVARLTAMMTPPTTPTEENTK